MATSHKLSDDLSNGLSVKMEGMYMLFTLFMPLVRYFLERRVGEREEYVFQCPGSDILFQSTKPSFPFENFPFSSKLHYY